MTVNLVLPKRALTLLQADALEATQTPNQALGHSPPPVPVFDSHSKTPIHGGRHPLPLRGHEVVTGDA